MSCPLLDKLAPETRNLIYEYALTFDTPLKHVHKMRPFLEKPGGSTESTQSNAQMASDEEPSPASESCDRLNTSILTASKLIYKEAIAVFYSHNTIAVDATVCKPENIAKLRATDLSLATRVTVKSYPRVDTEDGSVNWLGPGRVARFAYKSFSTIFPKLKTATVQVYTDSYPAPVTTLFAISAKLRSSPIFTSEGFSAVGTVLACLINPPDQAQINLVIQCGAIVDRWAKGMPYPDMIDQLTMSIRAVQETWNAEGNPPGTVDPFAHRAFNTGRGSLVPPEHPPIDIDSYEFWTVTEETLRQWQRAARVRAGLA